MNRNYLSENNKNNNSEIYSAVSPVTAAILGLVIVFFLFQFVGGFISLAIFGMDTTKANLTALRLFTIASQFLFILLPALILAFL